jgi:hypothetical protein
MKTQLTFQSAPVRNETTEKLKAIVRCMARQYAKHDLDVQAQQLQEKDNG